MSNKERQNKERENQTLNGNKNIPNKVKNNSNDLGMLTEKWSESENSMGNNTPKE